MEAAIENVGLLQMARFLVKISAFVLASVGLLYFGKEWSHGDEQLLLLNYNQFASNITAFRQTLGVPPDSPKHKNSKNATFLERTEAAENLNLVDFSSHQLKPARVSVKRFGIVDENGTMSNEFEVGDFDPNVLEVLRNGSGIDDLERWSDDGEMGTGVDVKRFPVCASSMMNYIPCLDNVDAVKKLMSIGRGEHLERHCPTKGKGLNCLIPKPRGYKHPVSWPKSRDEIWRSNVLLTQLAEGKGGENWIPVTKNKIRFQGGGTLFFRGADQYIDKISKMAHGIAFGQQTRVVLDIGCGVASFGAYLMSRNVLTLSIAPKDVIKNQIQFALERGVPAMVASFETHRLFYPSQAFDLIHCSECEFDWTRDDGFLLLEVNRMLRAGGHFVWADEPVYKHQLKFEQQWKVMVDLTERFCWEFVKREENIAIWRKPLNNSCYLSRREGSQPPLCDTDDDPDDIWYAKMKACITRLPENGNEANVSAWPMQLYNPPNRLQTINIEASISRNELYRAESRYGDEIVGSYSKVMHWKKLQFRNIMDMRAGFGGLAAALINQKNDVWVMNVVPVSGPNTLPVIYDRGLIGVRHDWCEPFDTYPRTYDFLHASELFSKERSRCDIASIMLEMDRVLRPGGFAYIHDSVTVIYQLKRLGDAMGWHVKLRDTSEGPYASYKLLVCEKRHKKKD